MKSYSKKEFVSDLIRALEDAEKASQVPKSKAQRAQDAYGKLQFDFPLVETQDLAALTDAFRAQEAWAVLTAKFVDVLSDCIAHGVTKMSSTANRESSAVDAASESLTAAFQKLLALSVLTTLTRALQDASNAVLLSNITLPDAAKNSIAGDNASLLESKVLLLSSRLSHHVLSSPMAWQDGCILSAAQSCLSAVRSHPKFLQMLPVAGMLCTLLHDRVLAAPRDLDIGLRAIMSGLCLDAPSAMSEAHRAACLLGLGVASSLAARLPAGPSKRQLWAHSREVWLPASAWVLEWGEAQQRRRKRAPQAAAAALAAEEEEHRHGVATAARLAAYYVTDAPPTTSDADLQEGLLSSGAFRGLVMAFCDIGGEPTMEPLRSGVLSCCAASPGLLRWAQAVPGFSKAWTERAFAPGGEFELHSALVSALTGSPAADGQAPSLATIFGAYAEELTPEAVPQLHSCLLTLSAVHSAQRGGPKAVPLWDAEFYAALRATAVALRTMKADTEEEEDKKTRNSSEENGESGGDDDELKLGLAADVRAEQLAARRVRALLPECLRMIKGLATKPGSALGKSD